VSKIKTLIKTILRWPVSLLIIFYQKCETLKQLHSTGETSKESITNFNRKPISRNTTRHQSLHQQAMLTGETLEG